MFKPQGIKYNIHDSTDRQLILVDDQTGEQKELEFEPNRITTSFKDGDCERLFDYYGREIQIEESIEAILEKTGNYHINEDQELFLVKRKDGTYAIARVRYYYKHSGGHSQPLIEYNSGLNPENGEIGQVWLECLSNYIFESYDKEIISDSCISYYLEKIGDNPKEYWLLKTTAGEYIIYCAKRHQRPYMEFFEDRELFAKGEGVFSSEFVISDDKKSLNTTIEIDDVLRYVETNTSLVDLYLYSRTHTALRGIPFYVRVVAMQ